MANKSLELIPYLDACSFSNEMREELLSYDISTHYQDTTFSINWKDSNDMPATQDWLIKTFGETIRQYRIFAICAT